MTTSRSEEPVPWWAGLAHDPMPIGGIAVALLLGTYALLGRAPSLPLLVAGGCGAALVYGLDRAVVASPEDRINHPERRRWVHAHRGWLAGEMGLCLAVGAAALTGLRGETLWAAGGLAALAALHLVPLGRWGRPLKSWGLGKPIVVAGAWALGATLLPVIETGSAPGREAWLLAGYRLQFILPNVLLADWGDRRGDAAAGVRSGSRLGTGRGRRWVATGLLGGAIGGACVAVGTGAAGGILLVDAVGPLLLLGAVWAGSPTRPGGRLVMDGLVAWPLVTALVAWALRGGLG